MKKFVTEHQSPYLDLSAEVSEILYEGKSDFQDIIVADSKEFGRMLVLDGVFQTSDKDEFIYHECITHIPLFLHPNPKNVLIIGGGDGGAAREAVRHPEVEHVTMVDIDGKVIELSKQFSRRFPKPCGKQSEADRQGRRRHCLHARSEGFLRRHHRRLLRSGRPRRKACLRMNSIKTPLRH